FKNSSSSISVGLNCHSFIARLRKPHHTKKLSENQRARNCEFVVETQWIFVEEWMLESQFPTAPPKPRGCPQIPPMFPPLTRQVINIRAAHSTPSELRI